MYCRISTIDFSIVVSNHNNYNKNDMYYKFILDFEQSDLCINFTMMCCFFFTR